MQTIKLRSLDARVAVVLAARRQITVDALIANLLREEAALEIAHGDKTSSDVPIVLGTDQEEGEGRRDRATAD